MTEERIILGRGNIKVEGFPVVGAQVKIICASVKAARQLENQIYIENFNYPKFESRAKEFEKFRHFVVEKVQWATPHRHCTGVCAALMIENLMAGENKPCDVYQVYKFYSEMLAKIDEVYKQ